MDGDIKEILTTRYAFSWNLFDVFVFEVDSVYQNCPTTIVIQYPEYQPVRQSKQLLLPCWNTYCIPVGPLAVSPASLYLYFMVFINYSLDVSLIVFSVRL
jgi:hypothetical protein